MPFKFDSRTFFLTYAQSGDLTQDQIVEHINSVKSTIWIRIARELHEDGSPHFHVVGKFTSRFQSRNERIFDVGGKHPNIQPVRSIRDALQYVAKDGEFHDIGPVPGGSSDDEDWVALAGTMAEPEYFALAMRSNIQYMYAQRFWQLGNRIYNEIPETYEGDITRECFELIVSLPHESKTTVVVGASGCGKSSWAKRVSLKPALWVRHLDVLRTFRPGYHKSIIFDEASFTHLPRETQIQLVDWHDEAHIHVRYGVAVIPAGVQKIVTANHYPFLEDPAIDRRVHRINILNPDI